MTDKKIYYFGATWCQPCKQMKPILANFKRNNPDVVLEEVDIDEDQKFTEKHGVMSVPTILVMQDQKEITRVVGVTTEEKLVAISQ